LEIDLKNILETRKPQLKKLDIIYRHLVAFIQNDRGELQGL